MARPRKTHPQFPPLFRLSPSELIETLMGAGWSQVDLAEFVGVTQATISRIAAGVSEKPDYVTVDRLREACLTLEAFEGRA